MSILDMQAFLERCGFVRGQEPSLQMLAKVTMRFWGESRRGTTMVPMVALVDAYVSTWAANADTVRRTVAKLCGRNGAGAKVLVLRDGNLEATQELRAFMGQGE